VLQRIIARSRLRGHNGLGFRYHTLRVAGLGRIVSLQNIQVCELTALTITLASCKACPALSEGHTGLQD
jgi:hypothetical protein